jgi:hypothetical protein
MNTRFGISFEKIKMERIGIFHSIFGLFFHLKTCGLAVNSKFEDFGTIFEKNKLILREAV